jgi:hypothetical protein
MEEKMSAISIAPTAVAGSRDLGLTDDQRELLERVVAELADRRDELVTRVVTEAAAQAGYRRLGPGQVKDFREHVGEGVDAILRTVTEHRAFTDADAEFVRPRIRRRTAAGVPEAEMLAVIRLFQRVLWDAVDERAGDGDDGHAVIATLARPLLECIDVLCRSVSESYAEAQAAMASRACAVRGELLEELLAGHSLQPGPALNAARACGLEAGASLVVVVARPLEGGADEQLLQIAARALGRAAGDADETLAAARPGEVVIVRAVAEHETERLARALDVVRQRLEHEGTRWAIGMSTLHDGCAAVPAAYDEACVALEHVRASGGLLALGVLDPLDYLILRVRDQTAWRLVPPAVRTFVEEDARDGGPLSETLLAYVDCDLNVMVAAKRLFVHHNTARYRLAKIEERTGLSVRRFANLQLLLMAIRLGGDAVEPVPHRSAA